MICRSCGSIVDDNAKKCKSCGCRLDRKEEPEIIDIEDERENKGSRSINPKIEERLNNIQPDKIVENMSKHFYSNANNIPRSVDVRDAKKLIDKNMEVLKWVVRFISVFFPFLGIIICIAAKKNYPNLSKIAGIWFGINIGLQLFKGLIFDNLELIFSLFKVLINQ